MYITKKHRASFIFYDVNKVNLLKFLHQQCLSRNKIRVVAIKLRKFLQDKLITFEKYWKSNIFCKSSAIKYIIIIEGELSWFGTSCLKLMASCLGASCPTFGIHLHNFFTHTLIYKKIWIHFSYDSFSKCGLEPNANDCMSLWNNHKLR